MQNGEYLDSCILMGANSSYSVAKDDCVYLETENECLPSNPRIGSIEQKVSQTPPAEKSTELIVELQVVIFYNFSNSSCREVHRAN